MTEQRAIDVILGCISQLETAKSLLEANTSLYHIELNEDNEEVDVLDKEISKRISKLELDIFNLVRYLQ